MNKGQAFTFHKTDYPPTVYSDKYFSTTNKEPKEKFFFTKE
jgi:hypothetical protein